MIPRHFTFPVATGVIGDHAAITVTGDKANRPSITTCFIVTSFLLITVSSFILPGSLCTELCKSISLVNAAEMI